MIVRCKNCYTLTLMSVYNVFTMFDHKNKNWLYTLGLTELLGILKSLKVSAGLDLLSSGIRGLEFHRLHSRRVVNPLQFTSND